jgi:hypothetical protein
MISRLLSSLVVLLCIPSAFADQSKSDLWAVLKNQTSVKWQGKRSLCTIFSSVAVVEAIYMAQNPNAKELDLSEEWLQYLNSLHSPTGGGNGATLETAFGLMKKYGMAMEKDMPFDGNDWSESSPQAQKYCKGLSDSMGNLRLTRCLNGHRDVKLMEYSADELRSIDPSLSKAKTSAKESLSTFLAKMSFRSMGPAQVKESLRRGAPVAVVMNVYYGSWNHKGGAALGIDDISSDLFAKGVVTYPEKGSKDAELSFKDGVHRHSVEIVGYDDNIEMTYTKKMMDGSVKTFSRKGVYYFKNSWDKKKFGSQFKVDGKKIPGFGMMPQDHANILGQFMGVQ